MLQGANFTQMRKYDVAVAAFVLTSLWSGVCALHLSMVASLCRKWEREGGKGWERVTGPLTQERLRGDQRSNRSQVSAKCETGTHCSKARTHILKSADPMRKSADPLRKSADPLLKSADPLLKSADPMLKSADPLLKSADPSHKSADPMRVVYILFL